MHLLVKGVGSAWSLWLEAEIVDVSTPQIFAKRATAAERAAKCASTCPASTGVAIPSILAIFTLLIIFVSVCF